MFEVVKNEKEDQVHFRFAPSETYICSFIICNGPLCPCTIIHCDFTKTEKVNNTPAPTCQISLDVQTQKIHSTTSEENLEFAEKIYNSLSDADWDFLKRSFYNHKFIITENESLEGVDLPFSVEKIENFSEMVPYNDILPYGESLSLKFNDLLICFIDQYCVKRKCGCTDAFLHLAIYDKDDNVINKGREPLLEVNYKTKTWKIERIGSLKSEEVQAVSKLFLTDLIFKKLMTRHDKLKKLYVNFKKKNAKDTIRIEAPKTKIKIKRNDPCICGSGKKYKKCCLK